MTDFSGRNIKRRLQQLEAFNRSLSGVQSTLKEKQQSCRTPQKASTHSKQTLGVPSTPPTPDDVLPCWEPIDAPAVGSSDASSVRTFLFGHTRETEDMLSISNQVKCDNISQQKNDRDNAFDLPTPLTDLESDMVMFVCSLQSPLLLDYWYWVSNTISTRVAPRFRHRHLPPHYILHLLQATMLYKKL